ncbi:hypothetical protein [uncultured Campylobacter sp.]|uniref:hypothetical protein n=1 Tax=uncultured Campylobacter sp. TaxID=218934 RepID=UPI0026099E91|nr:hypothetical protein [uncultured Campylobacter sp.]
MEFYFASCDDGILLLCRNGTSVLWRHRILSRIHLMATRNSISLRHGGISVLRRRDLFKFDAACDAPERPFKF